MDVIKAPNPALKIQTKPVKKISGSLLATLKDMIKLTQSFKEPEGVGLAAPQVGLTERFFVARKGYGKEFVAIINPRILSFSKRTKPYFEGCLSIPTIWGQVKRHINIKVSYQDIKGQNIIKTLKGIPAWIFQHEVDHLNGVLFTERVLQQKGKFYKFKGKDKTGTDIFEEITL